MKYFEGGAGQGDGGVDDHLAKAGREGESSLGS